MRTTLLLCLLPAVLSADDREFHRGLGEASISGGLTWNWQEPAGTNVINTYGAGYAIAVNRFLSGTFSYNLIYYGNDLFRGFGIIKHRAHEFLGGGRLGLPTGGVVRPYILGVAGGLKETGRGEVGPLELDVSASYPVAGGGAGLEFAVRRWVGFRLEARAMKGWSGGPDYLLGTVGIYFRGR